MHAIFLDFETYYSDDYSLRKMTPAEYVMDPRFEALGCGLSSGEAVAWADGPELPEFFRTIDWDNIFAVSHNAAFDMLILAWRYGIRPKMYGCTLSMANNWLRHRTTSCSLRSLSNYYELPAKWDTVDKLKGLGFEAILRQPKLHEEMRNYAVDDASKCEWLFGQMMQEGFPIGELETVDMVVRMAAQPKFELDMGVLSNHLSSVKAKKAGLLAAAGLDEPSSLMSDQQLAAKLLYLGVDPIPTKISKTTGKQAFAFAKSDKQFTELLEHDEPMVQALVAARLGHKSTLEESRTERLLAIGHRCPLMPVPLKYSGAHTHRFSGDWKINLQNLPRGGELRKALKAPKGKAVIAIDASQIEARINAVLSKQWDLVHDFNQGIDVYAKFAEQIYHYPVHKERQKTERFVGKTGILSLGYGSSGVVFQNMCRVQGDVQLQLVEANSIVQLYRTTYSKIVENWRYANTAVLEAIANGYFLQWGPVSTERHAIKLPNGNRLRYRDLRRVLVEGAWQWQYMRGAIPQKIYGAKLVENVVQALAFIHIMEVAKRVKHMTEGLLLPVHQVHDELIYVEDEHLAEMIRELVVNEMSKPPRWLPDAPLAAEGHIGETYYDAK